MPGAYDLEVYRGDTYEWIFTLWANTARTDPVDLTGATVAAEIRDRPAGTAIVPLTTTVTLPNIIKARLHGATWANIPAAGAGTCR